MQSLGLGFGMALLRQGWSGDQPDRHCPRQRATRPDRRAAGGVRPYASLIRLDRPIGAWLLFWPCAWSVALAGPSRGFWVLALWLALRRLGDARRRLRL